MGSDINQNPKYNSEKYVSIKIELNKICYYPGEFITGQIILSPKPGILQTNFSDPSINFTISQYQLYYVGDDDYISQNDDVLVQPVYFSNYIGANLLTNLNIPFSIQLPENIVPTCLIRSTDYCKHYLTIHIPSIEAKKTIIIIIKNNKIFTMENKLLKIPASTFIEKQKKSFLVNKGRIACFLKIPKNSFSYNEEIPMEIILDCSEFDLVIHGVIISIIRKNKLYDKNHSKILLDENKSIISKECLVDKNQECYIIKESIKFPTSSENKSDYPPNVYQLIEQENQNDLINKIHNYTLYHATKEGLMSIEYCLSVKILIEALFTFNEVLEIPIDFYSLPEEENTINYLNKNENNNDTVNNKLNHISEINDNSITPISGSKSNFIDINDLGDYSAPPNQRKDDKNKLNEITDMDFEIIDENDFYDILTQKKNNKKNKK